MLGMGGGKLWGPPGPPGPPCIPWKFLFSVGPELIHGGRFCGGGWLLLLGPEARGAPAGVLECPPPDVGTGASPSSAIRDRYSLSIRALSWADCGGSPPVALWAAKELVYLQSEEMWPAPPHLVHRVVFVMLRGSEFCQGRRILLSSSLRVPLSLANSLSCILRRSFWSSGVSIPCFRMFRICSTAFLTFSIVLAVTRAWRGSSSPGSICPSFLPTFPSFTEPLPRIMILAQHSFSIFFRVLPRGPISRPTKLISGYSSCGIITLSLTLVAGGL